MEKTRSPLEYTLVQAFRNWASGSAPSADLLRPGVSAGGRSIVAAPGKGPLAPLLPVPGGSPFAALAPESPPRRALRAGRGICQGGPSKSQRVAAGPLWSAVIAGTEIEMPFFLPPKDEFQTWFCAKVRTVFSLGPHPLQAPKELASEKVANGSSTPLCVPPSEENGSSALDGFSQAPQLLQVPSTARAAWLGLVSRGKLLEGFCGKGGFPDGAKSQGAPRSACLSCGKLTQRSGARGAAGGRVWRRNAAASAPSASMSSTC